MIHMGLKSLPIDDKQLIRENADLRIRLYEAEQALSAIYSGAVDALVLEGPDDHQVFTLAGAETPYRSFVEQMEEGAVSLTFDGTILYANQRFADMVGKPLETVVGSAFQSYVSDPESVHALLATAQKGSSRGELNLYHASMASVPVSASLHRLTGDEADLCMVVTDLSEIVTARLLVDELETRVVQRTADLLATNLELQGFTYSVSHDMRTPLRAMVSNAHIVMEDEGMNLSSTGCQQLQNISTAALKMSQLVDDLLQYARLGGCALTIERTNLGQLAKTVAEDVAQQHPGCSLELLIEPDIWAECDMRFVGMAIQNLVDNACKYRKVGEPARVSIGKHDDTDETIFFVQDQGIGFDMNYVHKLFMPFERLHRDSEYIGTGIGLANVRRAIERHGGRVWAEGQAGIGAKFFFTLPNAIPAI